ncbi:MAG TPA: hypothetical protein VGK23_08660 [Methanomassiliicoccales archaeon]
MTGQDDTVETTMILDLLHNVTSMDVQMLVRHFGENKRATIYRRLKELKKNGIVNTDRVHGRARYFLVQNRSKIGPVDKTPSEVDRLLIDECKNIVSEIIGSGVLQGSAGEASEGYNFVIAACKADAEAKGKPYPLEPVLVPSEILADNRRRQELRTQLLRRCESLHESLRWLEGRRGISIPGWWGTDYIKRHRDTQAVWSEPDKSKPAGDDWQGTHLLFWLEYYLGAIDMLSREQSMKNKVTITEKKRGRPRAFNP